MGLAPVKDGSIKDRILCAIVDHDNRLTRLHVHNYVECNHSILAIALTSMLNEGYLSIDGDHYSVTEEAMRVQGLSPVSRTESTGEKAGEQGGSAPGLNGAKAAEPAQPRPADVAPSRTPREPAMATKQKDGKKCTFCEETKDTKADFYEGHGRCKVCVNRISKADALKREGKPIPAHLQRYDRSVAAPRVTKAEKPVAPVPEKPIHVEPAADSSIHRIIPAGVIECRVMGAGKDAEAWVTQYGKTHIYGLTELQQLRDWASTVLKREMSA